MLRSLASSASILASCIAADGFTGALAIGVTITLEGHPEGPTGDAAGGTPIMAGTATGGFIAPTSEFADKEVSRHCA
jgi:hypothetical protein